MLKEFARDVTSLVREMTSRQRIAAAILIAMVVAYLSVLTYCQHQSFVRYQEQMREWEESTVVVGDRRVSREDYDRANERWREEHPEDYGIFD